MLNAGAACPGPFPRAQWARQAASRTSLYLGKRQRKEELAERFCLAREVLVTGPFDLPADKGVVGKPAVPIPPELNAARLDALSLGGIAGLPIEARKGLVES